MNGFVPVVFYPNHIDGGNGNWRGTITIGFGGSQSGPAGGSNWSGFHMKFHFDFKHWNAKPQTTLIDYYKPYSNRGMGGASFSGTSAIFVLWMYPINYKIHYEGCRPLHMNQPATNEGSINYYSAGGILTASFKPHANRDTWWDSSRHYYVYQ